MERTELLSEYASFLKRNYINQLEEKNQNYLDRLGVPIRRLYTHVSVDKLMEMNKDKLSAILTTMEKVSLNDKEPVTLLEQELLEIQRLAHEKLEPGGLLKLYAAQKQALFSFIPEFTTDTKTMQTLVEDIEHTFLGWQDATVQVYFEYRSKVEREQAASNAREETANEYIEKLQEVNKELQVYQEKLLHFQNKLLTEQEQIHSLNNVLTKKETELLRSNESLNHFANMASHDLKEPLRMVKQYVQLLARRYKDKLDKDADEFINYAVDGATRMELMIQSILDYSKLQNLERPVKSTNLNIGFNKAKENLTIAIRESSAKIICKELPSLKINEIQIIQVFQNLLSNAIKYRHPNRALEIHVNCQQKDNEWFFSVKDNGVGIDSENFERVFQPFERLHTWNEVEGIGLGLSFCKKIIEQYGGDMWVESEPDIGSSFFFTLYE
ncbi:MAG: GHKL domain-containing protein [Candidatus Sericytochromatia bacterium]|nr:GHKL domain-containing protein [Candidatus Sericytochromatia bacterium]